MHRKLRGFLFTTLVQNILTFIGDTCGFSHLRADTHCQEISAQDPYLKNITYFL